jgi:hypothetical protein
MCIVYILLDAEKYNTRFFQAAALQVPELVVAFREKRIKLDICACYIKWRIF